MGLWGEIKSSALAALRRRRNRTPFGIVEGVLGPKQSGNIPRKDHIEAYAREPWLRQSVAKIASGMAATQWQLKAVKEKGRFVRSEEILRMKTADRRKALSRLENEGAAETIEDHPLLAKLNDPNPIFGNIPLNVLDAVYHEIVGESFLLVGRGRFVGRVGRPLPDSFWPIPPHWVMETPTPDSPSFRVSYRGWQAHIPAEDVLWRVNLNPLNPYGRGLGIVPALAEELDADSSARRLINYAFYNRNTPDILVGLPGFTKEQVTAYADDWRAQNLGVQNVMRAHFVNVDAKVEKLGNDFREMQMIELRRFGRDTTREVLGLPPEVLGIIENSNRATIDAADFIFAKHVLVPRLEALREFRQRKLVPEYDKRLILDYVSPIEEDREFALKVAQSQGHMLKVDEWREMMGKDKLENGEGDIYVVTAGLQAVKSLSELIAKEPAAPGAVGPDGQPLPPGIGPDGKPIPPGQPGSIGPDGKPVPALDAQGNPVPPKLGPDGKPLPPEEQAPAPRFGEAPARFGEADVPPQAAVPAKPGVPPQPGAPAAPAAAVAPKPGIPPKPPNPFADPAEDEKLRQRFRSLERIAKMERVRVRMKHGDHDQSEHGNWARGGGKESESEGRKADQQESEHRAVDVSDPQVDAFAVRTSWAEKTAPSTTGRVYDPDVTKDANGDGLTDGARVGVPGDEVPPPPPELPRLPNLTEAERKAEDEFDKAFEKDPAAQVAKFNEERLKSKDPRVFETDAAKALAVQWGNPENRALLNTALHQAANAIAKRAFVENLDTLKPGDHVLVTAGGCGAGKGFALKNVPEAMAMKDGAKAIWDSAGDQNSTELGWIKSECDKRGLKMDAVFVHADPFSAWADPERGVVKRASDPKDGRMVDSDVFADSYALGGANFRSFADKSPDVSVLYLDNRAKPKRLDSFPSEAASIDRAKLYEHALKTIADRASSLPPHIVRGALIGRRIWRQKHEKRKAQAGEES